MKMKGCRSICWLNPDCFIWYFAFSNKNFRNIYTCCFQALYSIFLKPNLFLHLNFSHFFHLLYFIFVSFHIHLPFVLILFFLQFSFFCASLLFLGQLQIKCFLSMVLSVRFQSKSCSLMNSFIMHTLKSIT